MHQYFNPQKRAGGFQALAMTAPIRSLIPYTQRAHHITGRKSRTAPTDSGTFVKPVKQCFIKNSRLMPMTRLMLTLLSGWSGDGSPISTTIGIIAKHLDKSRRQVIRYLKDAIEEGYLYYSRTKCRRGLYTGIKIRLNLGAIRHYYKNKLTNKRAESPRIPDVTPKADTKYNSYLSINKDEALWKQLLQFGDKLGYIERKHR